MVFKIDDVSGTKKLKWLQTTTDLGFKCDAPIFIDRIKSDSLEIARKLQEEGKAEFPCHALSYYELMGFKFGYGPYGKKEVATRYDRMRKFYARNKLRIPKVLQCHWGEIGMQESKQMIKLGMKYILGYFVPDDAKHSCLDWKPKPYGRVDLFYDYSPHDPEFICFDCTIRGPHLDFLESLTVYAGHSDKNEIEAIIKRGTEQIIWGLSNGFFGHLVTHEQKISVIEDQDWEGILRAIKRNIEKFNPKFVLHEQIAAYIESRMCSRLKSLNIIESEFVAEFEGNTRSSIYLATAKGEEETCVDFVPIGKFENRVKVKEKIEKISSR